MVKYVFRYISMTINIKFILKNLLKMVKNKLALQKISQQKIYNRTYTKIIIIFY